MMEILIKKLGCETARLIILNKKMKDVQIIIKFLKDFGLLIKDVDQTIENEAKEQRGRFFGMSLGTLGAALLRKMLAGK